MGWGGEPSDGIKGSSASICEGTGSLGDVPCALEQGLVCGLGGIGSFMYLVLSAFASLGLWLSEVHNVACVKLQLAYESVHPRRGQRPIGFDSTSYGACSFNVQLKFLCCRVLCSWRLSSARRDCLVSSNRCG